MTATPTALKLVPVPDPEEARARARRYFDHDMAQSESIRDADRDAGVTPAVPVTASWLQAQRVAPQLAAHVHAKLEGLRGVAAARPVVVAAGEKARKFAAMLAEARGEVDRCRAALAAATAAVRKALAADEFEAFLEDGRAADAVALTKAELRAADLESLAAVARQEHLDAWAAAWAEARTALAAECRAAANRLGAALVTAKIQAIDAGRKILHDARMAAAGHVDAHPDVFTAALEVLQLTRPPVEPPACRPPYH